LEEQAIFVEAVVQVCVAALVYAGALAIVLWVAGALFYDVGGASRMARGGVLLWVAGVAILFVFWQPPWKPFLLLLVILSLFLVWWSSQKPSHHRNWEPNAAVRPRVTIEDDLIAIENVRNTEYRTFEDYTPKYDTRNYYLSQLRGLDVLIHYWGSPWICHPMFVFDFGEGGRVCISIEVRYRLGQDYSLARSLYRQQELIYVVCDERDAILRRTKYCEDNDVYLYRMVVEDNEIRPFFNEYVERINDLLNSPRWYHGLTTNCTTSIYRQRQGRTVWDWRLLVNGRLDRMLYDRKRLDQSQSFENLKQQSWVNEVASRAPRDGFGDYIRRELIGYCNGAVDASGPADGSETPAVPPQDTGELRS
jgi:hypothetical protein